MRGALGIKEPRPPQFPPPTAGVRASGRLLDGRNYTRKQKNEHGRISTTERTAMETG